MFGAVGEWTTDGTFEGGQPVIAPSGRLWRLGFGWEGGYSVLVAYSGEVGNVLGNIVLCAVTLIRSKFLEPRCYRKSSLIAYQHCTIPLNLIYKPNHSIAPVSEADNRSLH
jgi:hypothetical protein